MIGLEVWIQYIDGFQVINFYIYKIIKEVYYFRICEFEVRVLNQYI